MNEEWREQEYDVADLEEVAEMSGRGKEMNESY